jgi:hypothetical protein
MHKEKYFLSAKWHIDMEKYFWRGYHYQNMTIQHVKDTQLGLL